MQAPTLSTFAARNIAPIRPLVSTSEGAGLAHDAGNLLGALGLYCDLLDLPGVLRPEHLHYARELRLLSQRSGALINRLLGGESAAVRLLPERPPIRLCPAEVVKAFTPLLRSLAAPEVSLSMALGPDLPILPFAAEVLERILVNLIRNAATALRSYHPRDSARMMLERQIHVGVCGGEEWLRLTVTDNGPGMSVVAAASFMKPLPLPPGALSGLGHHVVHELVQTTGGELSITVVPNRGTTLQIEWPITPKEKHRKLAVLPRTAPGQISESLSHLSEQSTKEGAKISC
jgi:nitrogen-specific signal transduction histidine kinase